MKLHPTTCPWPLRGAPIAVLILAAALASAGCKPAPSPEPLANDPGPLPATTTEWRNGIGMAFRPIPGADVLLSVHETRVGDFAAFVDTTGYDASEGFYFYRDRSWNQGTHYWRDPGFEQSNDYPVVGVNWRDAVAFCLWLTDADRRSGTIRPDQAYRLPTENEWALAAGLPGEPPYPPEFANYHPLLGLDPFEFTSPAGRFPPNENGFHDMAGNAWEFCLDTHRDDPDMRIIRGGSWQNWHSKFVGVQARGRCSPDIRITLYGFRVALAADDDRIVEMRNDAMRVATPMINPPPDR